MFKESRVSTKINRARLVDSVISIIRDSIVSGDLRPGERLQQDVLARQMGVSRTPLREALAKLEEEGLVTVSPLRGVEVATLSAREILDLYEMRELLDGLAARLAADRVSSQQVAGLKRALDQLQRLVEKRWDSNKWMQGNLRFHQLVAEASNNKRMMRSLPSITTSVAVFQPTLITHPERATVALDEHLQIYEAIVRGDPEAAEQAARNHVVNTKWMVMKMMEGEPLSPPIDTTADTRPAVYVRAGQSGHWREPHG